MSFNEAPAGLSGTSAAAVWSIQRTVTVSFDQRFLDSSLSPGVLARIARHRLARARSAMFAARALALSCLQSFSSSTGPFRLAQYCSKCDAWDHGAPFVLEHPELFVSWAHSDNWVAAIAARSRCSIDVQEAAQVPDAALSAAELKVAVSAAERCVLWCRKEALIKAGVGSLSDLAAVDSLHPTVPVFDWRSPGVFASWAVS